MIYFVRATKYILLCSLFLMSFESNAELRPRGRSCHVIEGMSLPGCTPQAQPLECGPPKRCPDCGTARGPRTRIRGSSTSGVCGEWEEVCTGPPENRICQQVCREYLPPSCSNVTESCVDEIGPSIPGTGMYSCDLIECGCTTPPPEWPIVCQISPQNPYGGGQCVRCTADTPCPTGGQ